MRHLSAAVLTAIGLSCAAFAQESDPDAPFPPTEAPLGLAEMLRVSSPYAATPTSRTELPAAEGMLTYICGFLVIVGSPDAVLISLTVTGVEGGPQNYVYKSYGDLDLSDDPFVMPFAPCIPARDVNVPIGLVLGSSGVIKAWGFRHVWQ